MCVAHDVVEPVQVFPNAVTHTRRNCLAVGRRNRLVNLEQPSVGGSQFRESLNRRRPNMISQDPIHDDSVFRLTVSQPPLFAAGVVVDPFRVNARHGMPLATGMARNSKPSTGSSTRSCADHRRQ
jgi:hypothetical protein